MCASSQDGLVMVTRFGLLRLTRSTHFQTFQAHSSEMLGIQGSRAGNTLETGSGHHGDQ